MVAYEVPTLLLQFKNPVAESEFYNYFVDSLQAHDRFATLIFMAIAFSLNYRVINSKPTTYYHLATEILLNCFLLYVQRRSKRSFYAANRSAIIVGVRIFRMVMVCYFLLIPQAQEKALPFYEAHDFRWSGSLIWRLLIKSFVPILQSFGFLLPLSQHIWLQLLLSIGPIVLTDERCVMECARNPSFYSALYSSTLKLMAPLQGFKLVDAVIMEPLQLDCCRQQCNIVNIFMLFYMGYVVPTVILAAIQEPIRLQMLMEFGGSPIFHNGKVTLLYSLALLPILAILTLDLIYTFIFISIA